MKEPTRHRIMTRIRKSLGMNVFLCDSCQWDYRSVCHNPDRPNATWCQDYRKKGK